MIANFLGQKEKRNVNEINLYIQALNTVHCAG